MRRRLALVAAAGALALAALLALRAKSQHDAAARTAEADRSRALAREMRRRACGLGDAETLHEPESVRGECQKAALAALKVPADSAVFPGMFDDDDALASPFGCASIYHSWVEARDPSSGVEVRRAYSCTYDPRTGVATIELP
ncbi:MAG TPA: hypothetical protein VGI39_30860 [Polyangiaceae bacterium]|jgi:hypothetical protein